MFNAARRLPEVTATQKAVESIDWVSLAAYTKACSERKKSPEHMAHWQAIKAAYRAQSDAKR